MSDEPSDSEVAERLLEHLRAELGVAGLSYAEPPARITGGFDTLTYGFRLTDAPDDWSRPLILRLFRPDTSPERARFEAAVQRTVAATGYPAPRVLHVCPNAEALRGVFLIMERLPGRIMLEAFFRPSPIFFRLPRLLAETQASLHALDSEPLVAAMGLSPRRVSISGDIDQMRQRIDDTSLHGLVPGIAWLLSNRPPEPDRPVICHGDFHPLNILLDRGKVSGVIDWSWTIVGDAAYDVGATIAIFTQGPVDLPGFAQGVVGAIRRSIIRRYYDAYRKLRPIDDHAVRYFEALRCLGFLVEGGEHRQAELGVIDRPLKPSAWTQRRQIDGATARFQTLTGVSVSVPSMPA